MSFNIEYLQKVIATETHVNLNIGTDFEKIYNHCRLRQTARNLLDNPQDIEAQRNLSHLIVKLRVN